MENQELRKREGHVARVSARLLFCALLLILGTFGAAPLAHAAFTMPQNNLGLVGWWTMDHITGTTVVDSSGSGNNGTEVNGPVQVAGKIGQALSFNGTSQYISFGPIFPLTSGNFSMSAWVKTTANYGNVLSHTQPQLPSYPGWEWSISAGAVSPGPSDGKPSFWNGAAWVTANSVINDGNWHLITLSYNGSTVSFYKDGKPDGSFSESQPSSSTYDMYMAHRYNDSSAPLWFNGSIDDVRIYNRALTAAEVQTLYQSSLPAHIASSINTPDLANGLVGWWTFDGNDLSGTSVFDKSGSGNTGTTVNSPKLIAGQIGQALSFNGTSQYVNIPSLSWTLGNPITISYWEKGPIPTNTSNTFSFGGVNSSNVPRIQSDSPYSDGNIYWDYGDYSNGRIYTSFTPYVNKWTLVTLVNNGVNLKAIYINGSLSTSSPVDTTQTGTLAGFYIGRYAVNSGGGYMHGSLDDFRIYNRALSASEVKQIYDLGKQSHIASTVNPSGLGAGLVGHWSFDGGHLTTTTAYDTSGQGNNGTLVNSPKPVAGVLGQALSFNGSSYVTAPHINITSVVTMSAWIKPSSTSGYPTIVGQWYGGADKEWKLASSLNGNGLPYIDVTSDGATDIYQEAASVAPVGVWTFVVGVYNGASLNMYINGKLSQGTSGGTVPSSLFSGSAPMAIGAQTGPPSNPFAGSIDDVRIYNRALSASEVKQLYMLGH